ncbi:hypothetical protein AD936_11915 [Gluconobacter japonicus]|nr:hypothetical protein AD936_11915 [Gluconobacter japonicus]
MGIYGKMPNPRTTNAIAVQPRESPTKLWLGSLRNSVLQASEEAQYQLTRMSYKIYYANLYIKKTSLPHILVIHDDLLQRMAVLALT